MAELKTKPTGASVSAFLKKIPDANRRRDCAAVAKVMRQVTRARPRMWGPSIVGFGSYRYKYPSGREAEWFLAGFSPRKQNLTLYIMAGFAGYPELMKKLGKYKTGRSCLYVNRLEDVDQRVLKRLVAASVTYMRSLSRRRG
jgi:hypothetical protein